MKALPAISHRRRPRGYSLIEVLSAGAIVALGATAAASLAGSLGHQEEYTRRAAVVRNYQENMVQLWQLGLSPLEVASLMPDPSGNRSLRGALVENSAVMVETGLVPVGGAGAGSNEARVETVLCRASVNIAANPLGTQEPGAPLEITACRPSIR
jgi:hypothetical protein